MAHNPGHLLLIGQAVTQINLATKRICSVLVLFNKARGNKVTTGVDGFFAADRVLCEPE